LIRKVATWISTVGGAVAVLYLGLTWAWGEHNEFVYDLVKPLLRSSYVQRINNYRRMECDGTMTDITREALSDALADYEALVGRPISAAGGCDDS